MNKKGLKGKGEDDGERGRVKEETEVEEGRKREKEMKEGGLVRLGGGGEAKKKTYA